MDSTNDEPELPAWFNLEALGDAASPAEIQYRRDIGREGRILAEALMRWTKRAMPVSEPPDPCFGDIVGDTQTALVTALGYDDIEVTISMVSHLLDIFEKRDTPGSMDGVIDLWPAVFEVRDDPRWLDEHRTLPAD